MKKFNVTLILFLIVQYLCAQKEGNIWYFGQYAGLDFHNGAPVELTNGALYTFEGCSSVSDTSGNILFYTNGITVWNRNHVPMPNGTGLTGNLTSTQSAIIIKQPGTQNIYYVFSLFTDYCYSIVDMTLDNGFGDITAAKNVVIMSNVNSEKQCATHHANGTDIWITMNSVNSFYSYLLTSAGLNPIPVISTVGTASGYGPGQMQFSPLGNKIVFGFVCLVAGTPDVELFDFDNITGVVSNNIDIPNGYWQCYGVEFSPDNSKLYTTGNSATESKIYQYDLNAGSPTAIIASQVEVAASLVSNLTITGLQIGPDLKIYVCRKDLHYLAVINYPDSSGIVCNYVDSAVYLGAGICMDELPEFIADYWSPPLGLSKPQNKNQISFFPNPVKDYLYIRNDKFQKCFNIILYDIAGRKILETLITSSFQKVNVSQLSNAIYLLNIIIDGERTVKKIVKE